MYFLQIHKLIRTNVCIVLYIYEFFSFHLSSFFFGVFIYTCFAEFYSLFLDASVYMLLSIPFSFHYLAANAILFQVYLNKSISSGSQNPPRINYALEQEGPIIKQNRTNGWEQEPKKKVLKFLRRVSCLIVSVACVSFFVFVLFRLRTLNKRKRNVCQCTAFLRWLVWHQGNFYINAACLCVRVCVLNIFISWQVAIPILLIKIVCTREIGRQERIEWYLRALYLNTYIRVYLISVEWFTLILFARSAFYCWMIGFWLLSILSYLNCLYTFVQMECDAHVIRNRGQHWNRWICWIEWL